MPAWSVCALLGQLTERNRFLPAQAIGNETMSASRGRMGIYCYCAPRTCKWLGPKRFKITPDQKSRVHRSPPPRARPTIGVLVSSASRFPVAHSSFSSAHASNAPWFLLARHPCTPVPQVLAPWPHLPRPTQSPSACAFHPPSPFELWCPTSSSNMYSSSSASLYVAPLALLYVPAAHLSLLTRVLQGFRCTQAPRATHLYS
jgi:hypothetical protein